MKTVQQNSKGERRYGIVAKAIEEADLETIRFYLDMMGVATPIDDQGCTALMHAAASKGFEVLQFLLDLEHRAALDTRDYLGLTALMHAARAGNRSSVYLLLGAGADVNIKDNDGETALMIAARAGDRQIVNLLVGQGAALNVRSKFDGTTAVMAAAAGGHRSIMELLIGRGAYRQAKDFFGFIADDWLNAKRYGRRLCAAMA
ncbi:ankyrin repeat domain-containing protein [Bdellovibrionota bacterium FG-1]